MKGMMSAELYRMSKYKIIFVEMFFLTVASLFFSFKEYPVFQRYQYMAPFFAAFLMCYVYMIGFACLTGMIIGEDFRNGCTGTVIARSNRRIRYYFGKLTGQFLICGGLFLLSVILYSLFRELFGNDSAFLIRDQYLAKLLIYLLVALLQIMAMTAIYTMITFLIRKTVLAVSICMALIMVELLAKQLARTFQLFQLEKLFLYTPFGILNRMNLFVIPDLYLHREFILLCIPPMIIIFVTSVTGAMAFRKIDLE